MEAKEKEPMTLELRMHVNAADACVRAASERLAGLIPTLHPGRPTRRELEARRSETEAYDVKASLMVAAEALQTASRELQRLLQELRPAGVRPYEPPRITGKGRIG